MANAGPKFGEGRSVLGVATNLVLVTPHDTNENVPDGARALLIGSAGTLNLDLLDGTTVTGVPVQAGVFPVSVLRVRTGGTASNIWAMV